MAKNPPVTDVVDEIFQSILATPKRQRRLRSATFWDKFGFERRTKERVEQVRYALQKCDLIKNVDDATFGAENKNEWVILSYVEPHIPALTDAQAELSPVAIPTPPDSWFATMEQRGFESEREVEYYFVMPLFEQLGYEEDDFAIGYPVQMYEGSSKVNKEADLVLFNGAGRSKENTLLVVEAKKLDKMLTEDRAGQARSYANWVTSSYYLITNGDEIWVYLYRGPVQPDVKLMTFRRAELRLHWAMLYQTLNKAAVIEYKAKWKKLLETSGM